MKISFTKSILLSCVIIFCANIYLILTNTPPDGRWKIEISITSIFIIIYIVLFTEISRKLFKNKKGYHAIIIFNTLLSFVFLIFARKIQFAFQDYPSLYVLHLVPSHPYVVIFGLGLIIYIPVVLFLAKKQLI